MMRMSLEVLKHLGFNLYSNVPTVLSEAVANAYDADAQNVNIRFKDDKIIIEDDGHGMSRSDINQKYLLVGYAKRKDSGHSKILKRPVMGRKGIGKLSLFSLANQIEIHTSDGTNRSSFILNRFDIETEIDNDHIYYPKEINPVQLNNRTGTRIILSKFKKSGIQYYPEALRKRLARRFSVLGDDFRVSVNDVVIGLEDRNYFSRIQLMWHIGNPDPIASQFEYVRVNKLSHIVDEKKGWYLSGWIGSAKLPGDLDEEDVNNNKISLLCRGKMAKEDILDEFNESGMFATYLIGEIHADFLDIDTEEDIATSSRQSLKEDDPRYQRLLEHFYILLKDIKRVWGDIRSEISQSTAVATAEAFNPALIEWYDGLKTESNRKRAKQLFATIDGFQFDKSEAKEKKRILYKQGILAFEKLSLLDNLERLDSLQTTSDFELSSVFTDLNDIEANMYYDIASERVSIIRKFQNKLNRNDKEKLIQKHLFDNLWLLHPSWERATEGTESIEQNATKEFKKVVKNFTEEEKRARYDIRYRTSAGKHIIIELKRYIPSYTVKTTTLLEQVQKYTSAMRKILDVSGHKGEPIECIIVLGKELKEDKDFVEKVLRAGNARVIYYDELIAQSLQSYDAYLNKQKITGRLQEVISRL